MIQPQRRATSMAGTALLVVAAMGIGAYLISRSPQPEPAQYLALAGLLFAVGTAGVLLRRNALVMFMSIELMLNAVNLTFIVFAKMRGTVEGQVLAFFVLVVAAAEVVVGLAILVALFRRRETASVDDARGLKW